MNSTHIDITHFFPGPWSNCAVPETLIPPMEVEEEDMPVTPPPKKRKRRQGEAKIPGQIHIYVFIDIEKYLQVTCVIYEKYI